MTGSYESKMSNLCVANLANSPRYLAAIGALTLDMLNLISAHSELIRGSLDNVVISNPDASSKDAKIT